MNTFAHGQVHRYDLERRGVLSEDREDGVGVLTGQRIPWFLDRVGDLYHGEAAHADLHTCVGLGVERFDSPAGESAWSGHVPNEDLGIGEKAERQRSDGQVVAETLPGSRYSVLSGPSHAEEVADGKPAAVVAASSIPGEAELWQGIFSGKLFRVYTSDDVVGVEIGGAVKNVIAIAAGIAASREMGHNALAALVCRGLAEVMRLGAKLGAYPLTLAGLAGVGDLMVTCFSGLSRNYRLGLAVGGGMTLTQALNSLGQVAEGAYTVDALVRNAREIDIELSRWDNASDANNAQYVVQP